MAKTPRIITLPDAYKLSKVSSTQISLQSGSRVTIAGIQYPILSDITLSLSGLTANSLYMVYAVTSGGSVTLTYSTNVNSIGPAGYTSWKLVGAFYADGLASPSFGSFVNTEGAPISDWIQYLPGLSSGGGGSVTLNATGAMQVGYFGRTGDSMKVRYVIKNGSGGTASGAAGNLQIGLPSPLLVGSLVSNDSIAGQNHGAGGYFDGTNPEQTTQLMVFAGGSVIVPLKTSSIQFVQVANMVAGTSLTGIATFPIQGWTNTPLKDL